MVGRKRFVYQERHCEGWCGPAVLTMALRSLGFSVTQEEMAKVAPYDPDWGTDHTAMVNGARQYVPEAYEAVSRSLDDLAKIAKNNAVILNFMDTELGHEPPHGAGNGEDGHYVLLDKLTGEDLMVVDPNPISPVDGGFRKIDSDWFERHFWDIGRGWKVMERWALVIPAAG